MSGRPVGGPGRPGDPPARRGGRDDQIGLFGATPAAVAPAPVGDALRRLAEAWPERVRLGTSSWSFPGWQGTVWAHRYDAKLLAREGLPAYAAHPLLRTVGVDRTYHAPVEARVFETYAAQVPTDFRFLVKAHVDCVVPRFPDHPRHGALRGRTNPRFFDPDYAADRVVAPFVAGLRDRGGVVLFQCPPLPVDAVGGPAGFVERLRGLLTGLPRGPLYAVELRNRQLLDERYAAALAECGAVHCVSVHPSMPPPTEQYRRTGGHQRRALVMRWMLRRDLDYASAFRRYSPFDRLVDPDLAVRAELAALVAGSERRALVIVNNKAEGSAPRSIELLARAVLDAAPA